MTRRCPVCAEKLPEGEDYCPPSWSYDDVRTPVVFEGCYQLRSTPERVEHFVSTKGSIGPISALKRGNPYGKPPKLHSFRGGRHTVKEIAEMIGCSSKAIHTRLQGVHVEKMTPDQFEKYWTERKAG